MSDSVSANSYGRAALGQDVAKTIEELGDIDVAKQFRELFPCRSLTPREYAENHLLKHKVKYVFVGLGEEIPAKCPQGYDLLIASGVAFTYRELEELVRKMSAARTGERVLLGLPLAPINVVKHLRELSALQRLSEQERYAEGTPSGDLLAAQEQYVRQQFRDQVRKALAPSSFRWICQGGAVEGLPAGSRDGFASAFLQMLYNASPAVRLGASNRHFLEALDELLDFEHPVQISNLSRKGAFKVLRRFMVNSGIFVRTEDCGSYSRYDVNELMPSSDWASAWRCLTENLLGDGSRDKSADLGAFGSMLLKAPWGLPRVIQALLLAAMLRREHSRLSMEFGGEPRTMTGSALLDALANPKGWKICYRPALPHEMAYLAKIREIFAGEQPAAEGAYINIWDRTLRAVSVWYQGLSGIAKLHKETMSPETLKFVELITDVSRRDKPEELLGRYLPELGGETGVPQEEGQEALLNWIAARKRELENRVAEFKNNLCLALGSVLGREAAPEEVSVQWFDAQFKQWLERLHYGTDKCALSPLSSVLRMIYDIKVTPEERWFVVVPQQMEIPALGNWNRDMTALYKSRFAKCCVELQTWSVYQIAPWAATREDRAVKVAEWMAGAFAGMNIKKDQREAVLLDMIEQIM